MTKRILRQDRKSTRLNSSHLVISYAVFCLKKKKGSSTTYTVNTQATAGAQRPVNLSATGLPAGASATFNPASVTAGQSSPLTVATTATAATGTFGFTITGQYSSPPVTHSTAASLTVMAALDDVS